MNTKKFIFKTASLYFLSILVLISCKGDTEDIIIDSPIAINGLEVMTYGYYGKKGKSSGGTTIASFADQQTYDNYIANLETQVEAWDDQFVAQWGHLNEDALNDKEEALGFDSEKPLTDFENQAGLNSLRQQYLAEEDAWLNNEMLNDATDPDNKPEYDFDENEMAVINNLAEVKIGSTIYKQLNEDEIVAINNAIQRKSIEKSMPVVRDGAMLEIGDADFNTLIEFNEGNTDVINNGNVNVNTSSSECRGRVGRKIKREYDNGNRMVRLKVKFRSFARLSARSKAKIQAFKKKRGKWKHRRTNLGVAVQSYSFCGGNAAGFSGFKRKKRKKLKRNMVTWNTDNNLRARNGQSVVGRYEFGGLNDQVLTLTW